jgi:hypothetical protein
MVEGMVLKLENGKISRPLASVAEGAKERLHLHLRLITPDCDIFSSSTRPGLSLVLERNVRFGYCDKICPRLKPLPIAAPAPESNIL